jgi:chemotaxis protein methyltransferase CheR
MESYSHIRIWCAGSSKGQEAYSIAIMLAEYGLLERSIIYATDFNGLVLEQAKNGIYSKEEYLQCEENYLLLNNKNPLEKWFEIEENYVIINDEIRRKVHFFQHNLVTDGEINEFHIVFCRNVLIYFNEKLQKKVINLIYSSLVRDGYLILGDSEHINGEEKFKRLKNNSNSKVFKKILS